MRIALVHDLLTQLGGAERVLEVLHEIYPKAPVYTLLYDKEKTNSRYSGWDIRTSYLQKFLSKKISYKWLLPLMSSAIETFDMSAYDLIISDSSAFAKGVKVDPAAKHICYCHTPTRYLWQDREDYIASLPYPWFVKAAVRPILSNLRKWDYSAAQKIDNIVANSHEVEKRIRTYYDRDSIVIYPPVNTDFFCPTAEKKERAYFLAAGRLEPYKKIGLVVEAFSLLGLPLVVAGGGSMEKIFKQGVAGNIKFLGRVSDDELKSLYQGALALIFPALEDAGLMIVESMACGTPVIAYRAGGALEFIEEGRHGEFFDEQNVESISAAVRRFDFHKYDTGELVRRATMYDQNNFKKQISDAVNMAILNRRKT